jgi:hypothetical protein
MRIDQRRGGLFVAIAKGTLTDFGAEDVRSDVATFVRPCSCGGAHRARIAAVHRSRRRVAIGLAGDADAADLSRGKSPASRDFAKPPSA